MRPIILKYVRLLSGLTQKELAEKVNISHSMISRIEDGTVPIQPETQFKMLQAFSDQGIDTRILIEIDQLINNVKGD
jgi:transcriptional regulator with XRE-family HTH domain